jgi:hypothetical protein
LPPREAPLVPWDEVAVDFIGPWKIEIQGQEIEFNALKSMDPVTNLLEMICIKNKTSDHIATQFENSCSLVIPGQTNAVAFDHTQSISI